ncbi:MAG: porin [Gammaproteobacteria bacterium]
MAWNDQILSKYGLSLILCLALANNVSPADELKTVGLLNELTGRSATEWLRAQGYGIEIGGWATVGINYNRHNPSDRSNGPISMTDRNSEFNLYQLDLYLEKAVKPSGQWDIGGRADFMFGTDARYTQATGHWDSALISRRNERFYTIALPQAYLEVFAPYGHGLAAKLGHFYGIIGYESVPSSPNFFSSHTYSFKSSPFTATGVLFDYALTEQWTINLGAVTGADNFDRDFGAWSHMSGLTWNDSNTGTTLSFAVLQGDVYQKQSSELVYYTACMQQTLGKWKYVLQHDRGAQQNALGPEQNAEWYSVVHYLTYQAGDSWGVGLRGEWFKDQHGIRYSAGTADYFAVTAGLNWRTTNWLTIRPEARYDWANAKIAPFAGGKRNDQVVLGVDAVVQF